MCSMASSGETEIISAIVQHLKSGGIFDQFRRECLSDADTKPSFQNLLQRVDGYVCKFLSQQKWHQSLNKNQLRERLRAQINESGMLKYGIEHLVDQVVNPKINSSFLPKIEAFVKEFLGIQEITEKRKEDIKDSKIVESDTKKLETREKTNRDGAHEEPQPMDIETGSESSRDVQKLSDKIDNSQTGVDSDNQYLDWPTPPQPEMLTPDRKQDKCVNSFDGVLSNVKENSDRITRDENISNESSEVVKPKKVSHHGKHIESKKEIRKEEDLSDVSSVHTSDLSDFDDEISLSSNDEQEKDRQKKKISLKVVKEITSREQSREGSTKIDILSDLNMEEERLYSKRESNVEHKRIRRMNPKYISNDFSSIFTEKRFLGSSSKDGMEEESENSNNSINLSDKSKVSKSVDTQANTRKRRPSNVSEADCKESDESNPLKSIKLSTISEIASESRCSSRNSIESSSLSETTQDSVSSQLRTSNRKSKKLRAESQTQRYEASDLYKPRPRISSSRVRTRPTASSESNAQLNTSNVNDSGHSFVIHDLSK